MKKEWKYPPISLLDESLGQKADRGDIYQNARIIENTLNKFGILGKVVEVNLGPQVTQYALKLELGNHIVQNNNTKAINSVTSISEIISHANDFAHALNPPTGKIRIEAPIPGRDLVGIEIPNRSPEFISLKGILNSDLVKYNWKKLSVPLGLDISGAPNTLNITDVSHILIAGTVGSGRLMLIKSWITSLIYRKTDQEVRLILIDSKRSELSVFGGLPHLLSPLITDPMLAFSAFNWVISEMERRYRIFAEVGVKNIDEYNKKFDHLVIPFIVLFIDELAELMDYDPVQTESKICKITEMGRDAGIHLIFATKHLSTDVVTKRIKVFIPSRITFKVSSVSESQIIIDMPGAEKLQGDGDMLYISQDKVKPSRVQSVYVSDQEIKKVVDFLIKNNKQYELLSNGDTRKPMWQKPKSGEVDPLFNDAVRIVCQYDRASITLLQRDLSIGFAHAASILDQLGEKGLLGPAVGSQSREVLMHDSDKFIYNMRHKKISNFKN